MKRKRFCRYSSNEGDFLELLAKRLPAAVYHDVYCLYLIYSVEDMLKFEDFELFRATYKSVRVTFQQYVNTIWCCKIEY